MRVPLTINDFLHRAELLYGARTGIIDEPDQPAESLGRGAPNIRGTQPQMARVKGGASAGSSTSSPSQYE